jgi:hypothetical protein
MDSGSSSQKDIAALVLFTASIYACFYSKVVKKPVVIPGNEHIAKIMDMCPSLHKTFWPTPYCWNAHLQFVPFVLFGAWDKYIFPPFRWYRQMLTLDDGEQVALDWVVPSDINAIIPRDGLPCDTNSTIPVLMLHHGAMCDSSDLPGQSYIRPALERGWFVCALNRRGHTTPLTKPKWNFFGCSKDVKVATQSILARRPKAVLLTLGLSSGTAIVATNFGKPDEENDFHAGVGVCPGFSIEKCLKRFTTPYMVRPQSVSLQWWVLFHQSMCITGISLDSSQRILFADKQGRASAYAWVRRGAAGCGFARVGEQLIRYGGLLLAH